MFSFRCINIDYSVAYHNYSGLLATFTHANNYVSCLVSTVEHGLFYDIW